MPELPEVETVCRGLAKAISGRRIARIETRRKGLRIPFPRGLDALKGARIGDISRRAKYIVMRLSGGRVLLLHLGMSGRMVFGDRDTAREKHDHMIITLDDGTCVIFNDPRRFGLVDLTTEKELAQHRFFRHLGPEPLEKDFTATALRERAEGRKTAIKLFVMDQRIVVGVGNIYASEALHMAGIDPTRAAGDIDTGEMKALVRSIRTVLRRAIRAGGSSIRDYVQADGELGYFQHHWSVYDKSGRACTRCKAEIRKINQGGRSTFYCPACQK